jgi:hypothetical protein
VVEQALRGAYGFRIAGVEGKDALLVPAEPGWPTLRLQVELVEEVPPADERVSDDVAVLNLKTGGRLTVDRASGTARFQVKRPLSPDELVHPYLAPVAAIAAHWHGRIAFHAGGVGIGGRAWGVVGEREAGKSSLLASCALAGKDIVADDVLVIAAGSVLTGPRSIDLREDSAERFGGEAIGLAGARPRWRMPLPTVSGALPFAGWIFLAWGDEVTVRSLPPSEGLARLMGSLALRVTSSVPATLLDLASLPAWELRRPRDWRQSTDAAMQLLASLESGTLRHR